MDNLLGWFLIFILHISLLGILSYQLMCLTDLEGDYINPYDSASRINMLVFPEFITQGILCILFLITGHWFMFLLCLPYLLYNVRLYRRRLHLVDITEIYNQLTWEKKLRLYKLGYLIILLVLCIFWYCDNSYFGLLEEIIINRGISAPYKFAHSFSCGGAEILTLLGPESGDFANLIRSQYNGSCITCIIVLVASFYTLSPSSSSSMSICLLFTRRSLLVPFKFVSLMVMYFKDLTAICKLLSVVKEVENNHADTYKATSLSHADLEKQHINIHKYTCFP